MLKNRKGWTVNDGFSDQQAAGTLQKNLALDTPDSVNLPFVTDEFTDQPAVDPGQKDTAAKSEENASPTKIVDQSTDKLTDAANSGHKTFWSKEIYPSFSLQYHTLGRLKISSPYCANSKISCKY